MGGARPRALPPPTPTHLVHARLDELLRPRGIQLQPHLHGTRTHAAGELWRRACLDPHTQNAGRNAR